MTGIRERYCIVGVGETAYLRESNRTTRAMGVEAVTKAMMDAGLPATEVDGLLSYHRDDSTLAAVIAEDLGIRPNFHMDCTGGGSSIEALVGLACGAIETGMCHTVAIYRSMNGHTGRRPGGSPTSGRPAATAVTETALETLPYGISSAAQLFQFTFARHMHEFGTTNEQLAAVKSTQSNHASNNPKAYYKRRLTVEDVARFAVDNETSLSPAGLLCGDRQCSRHHRYVHGTGQGPETTTHLHHGRGRPCEQAVSRQQHALPMRTDHAYGWLLRQGADLPE